MSIYLLIVKTPLSAPHLFYIWWNSKCLIPSVSCGGTSAFASVFSIITIYSFLGFYCIICILLTLMIVSLSGIYFKLAIKSLTYGVIEMFEGFGYLTLIFSWKFVVSLEIIEYAILKVVFFYVIEISNDWLLICFISSENPIPPFSPLILTVTSDSLEALTINNFRTTI